MSLSAPLSSTLKYAEYPYMGILHELVAMKYTLILAYIHYGDQLRSVSRDSLYEHMQQHMAEERQQLYMLNKKITALFSDALCNPNPIPTVNFCNPHDIFLNLQALETQSVALWARLAQSTANSSDPSTLALNNFAQDCATECQGHVDDMIRYLRSAEASCP